MTVGVCVPIQCDAGSIKYLAERIVSLSPSNLTVDCYSEQQFAGYDYLICFIALVILAIVAYASLKDKKNSSSALLTSFSITRNLKYLNSSRDFDLRYQINLSPVDGFKVLSMLWTIVVHSYNFSIQWLQFDNVKEVRDVYSTVWTQWIANGTFSVDNFLIISGLLSSLKFHSRPSESLSESVLRRYLRLAPAMVLLILFSINVLPFLDCGPSWAGATVMFDQWCRKNWPINLFMLQNYINTQNMCYSHTWFISVEMQLFLAVRLFRSLCFTATQSKSCSEQDSSLRLLVAEKRRKCFLTLLILLCACGQLLAASLVYLSDLPAMPLLPATPSAMNEYYGQIYIKPFYWFSSYVAGAVSGEIIRSRRARGTSSNVRKAKLNTVRRCADCIGPEFCALLAVLLIWSNLSYFRTKEPMSKQTATIYTFVTRPIWSVCMTVILYRLVVERREKRNWLRILRNFLSMKIWRPLSRLSFGAYLLHPVIMAMFYGSRSETFNMTPALMLYFTAGNIFLTYFAAMAFFLLVESPIRQILSLLLFRKCPPTNSHSEVSALSVGTSLT